MFFTGTNTKRGDSLKANGIVRKIDELGRIVIPMEIRNTLELRSRDSVQISLEDERIVLTKFGESCVFCGSREKLKTCMGKQVCQKCANEAKKKL